MNVRNVYRYTKWLYSIYKCLKWMVFGSRKMMKVKHAHFSGTDDTYVYIYMDKID